MKNSKEIFRNLQQQITLKEDLEEIQSILYLVAESVLGLSRADIISEKPVLFDSLKENKLNEVTARINRQEPIQYILGEADFFGRKFLVNSSVLIPRQETELLIHEILKFSFPKQAKILDIGSGSGCIAITLALEILEAEVTATDVSEKALIVAKQNADSMKASIQFLRHDILKDDIPGNFDLIVSNPPYISKEEKNSMHKNVLDYEPHLALFSENDPMLFYREISAKAKKSLKKNGKVLVEINEHFGPETLSIFQHAGFSKCQLIKDLQNKDRILVAQ